MFGPKHEPAYIGLITDEPGHIERNGAVINIFGSQTIPDGAGKRLPMIDICTVTDAELADRVAHGEEAIDVIDEHTSAFWFSDRATFRSAWGAVRELASGKKFPARFLVGHLNDVPVGADGALVIVAPSAHHISTGWL